MKLTQMSELAEKGIETVIINVLRNLSRDIKDIEETPYLVHC